MKKIRLFAILALIAVLAISCSPESKTAELKNGDIVTLGKIPASDTKHGGEDITWKVLKVEGSRALIISEKILTEKAHSTTSSSVSAWSNSEINKWLNGDFLTAYALDKINMAAVEHSEDGKDNKSSVSDEKVFLLSDYEAGNYFRTYDLRKCENLDGVTEDWLMRDKNSGEFYYVDANGHDAQTCSETEAKGIRPAFWYVFK